MEALKRREMLRSVIDKKQISELINTKFETIDPETSLSDAVAKMRAADLYEIPVVSKKKLVGVLSFGSMVKKRTMVVGMKVKGLMDIPPGITEETTITEAAEQFIAMLEQIDLKSAGAPEADGAISTAAARRHLHELPGDRGGPGALCQLPGLHPRAAAACD